MEPDSDRAEKGIGGQDDEQRSPKRHHQRLQVPEAILEAPVILACHQPGQSEGQPGDGDVDEREEAAEEDGWGTGESPNRMPSPAMSRIAATKIRSRRASSSLRNRITRSIDAMGPRSLQPRHPGSHPGEP